MMLWILTEEYNEYDQHGSYFLAAWAHKPRLEELIDFGIYRDTAKHVLLGGGRQKDEHRWYNLFEVEEEKQCLT